jgi:hypothetical protein
MKAQWGSGGTAPRIGASELDWHFGTTYKTEKGHGIRNLDC